MLQFPCSLKPLGTGSLLTEVASTDRTQWGLYQRPWSRFSQTDLARLIWCLLYGQTGNERKKKKILLASLRELKHLAGFLLSLVSNPNGTKIIVQSVALYKLRQCMKTKFFIQVQWKSFWLKQYIKSDQNCNCNVSNACLCLDRSAISSHSALRSSTDHHRKRWCWMCSLRTCLYALRQKLPGAGFVGLWRHFAALKWRYWPGFLWTERMYLAHDSG